LGIPRLNFTQNKEHMQVETVEQFLARGGKITKMQEVKLMTWQECRDLLEKWAWATHVPEPTETEEEEL